MNEPIQIPAEYLPIIDAIYTSTIVFTAVWLLLVLLIHLRRRASNLTPIHAARVNRKARPDFLKVDHKKQRQMEKDGAAYDAELDRQDAADARAEAAAREPDTVMARIARLLAVIMSIFTLATMVGSVLFNINYLRGLLSTYSAGDRLVAVVTTYPIATTVAVLVISYHLYTYVAGKKWRAAA
jgi:hypothetical protein